MSFFVWMWPFLAWYGWVWRFLAWCGWVWPFLDFVWVGIGEFDLILAECYWVWVSVTIYWLGVSGCGLLWPFFGWVWVRVTFSWLGVGGYGWVHDLWLPSIYGYYQVHPVNPFYYRFMFSKINFELTLFSYQMNYCVGHFRVYLRR